MSRQDVINALNELEKEVISKNIKYENAFENDGDDEFPTTIPQHPRPENILLNTLAAKYMEKRAEFYRNSRTKGTNGGKKRTRRGKSRSRKSRNSRKKKRTKKRRT
jgi:hypothetical protein